MLDALQRIRWDHEHSTVSFDQRSQRAGRRRFDHRFLPLDPARL
jgi:hypothetical protein